MSLCPNAGSLAKWLLPAAAAAGLVTGALLARTPQAPQAARVPEPSATVTVTARPAQPARSAAQPRRAAATPAAVPAPVPAAARPDRADTARRRPAADDLPQADHAPAAGPAGTPEPEPEQDATPADPPVTHTAVPSPPEFTPRPPDRGGEPGDGGGPVPGPDGQDTTGPAAETS